MPGSLFPSKIRCYLVHSSLSNFFVKQRHFQVHSWDVGRTSLFHFAASFETLGNTRVSKHVLRRPWSTVPLVKHQYFPSSKGLDYYCQDIESYLLCSWWHHGRVPLYGTSRIPSYFAFVACFKGLRSRSILGQPRHKEVYRLRQKSLERNPSND